MGEATFTKPFVNWMERRRAKKAAKEAEPAERERPTAVSVEPDVRDVAPPLVKEAAEPAPAAQPLPVAGAPTLVDEGTDQLPLGLRDVFTSAAQVSAAEPAAEPPPPDPVLPSVSPPVQRVSVEASAEEGAAETVSAVRPVEQPAPTQRPQSGSREVLDSMSASLRDVFRKKTATNPQLKALLKRHGTVDALDLTEELTEFAKSIGATGGDSSED